MHKNKKQVIREYGRGGPVARNNILRGNKYDIKNLKGTNRFKLTMHTRIGNPRRMCLCLGPANSNHYFYAQRIRHMCPQRNSSSKHKANYFYTHRIRPMLALVLLNRSNSRPCSHHAPLSTRSPCAIPEGETASSSKHKIHYYMHRGPVTRHPCVHRETASVNTG